MERPTYTIELGQGLTTTKTLMNSKMTIIRFLPQDFSICFRDIQFSRLARKEISPPNLLIVPSSTKIKCVWLLSRHAPCDILLDVIWYDTTSWKKKVSGSLNNEQSFYWLKSYESRRWPIESSSVISRGPRGNLRTHPDNSFDIANRNTHEINLLSFKMN